MMKTKGLKKALLVVVVIIFIALFSSLAIYLKSVGEYKRAVSGMALESISASGISDGEYTGECDVNFIRAKVRITVKDGAITAIDILEHKNDRGAAAEAVIGSIIKSQSTKVDTVAGATNSSKVLIKAVENALKTAG